ncbi:MAG: type II toxin-antitoxin system VapC family toxin [Thermodesulfobacteriota bacterium]
MVVVDTDIIIWILRGNQEMRSKFYDLENQISENLFITPVQLAEIYSGIRERERSDTKYFIETLRIIDINEEIGLLAGELLNKYKKSHNLTLADSLTGAATKYNNFRLWTLNKKHYPMFDYDELFI